MSMTESSFSTTGSIKSGRPNYVRPSYSTTVIDSGSPASGVVGARWFSLPGLPGAGLGDVGDFYLDIATGTFYEKTGTVTWTARGSLQGPRGGNWVSMTLAEYNALAVKDPTTLYLIKG